MESTTLNYDDDGFASRARKLIVNGQTFSFEIVGEPFRQLAPYVTNGRITDPAKLGSKPKLRGLLVVLTLAGGQGRAVSLEFEQDRLCVWVGVGKA